MTLNVDITDYGAIPGAGDSTSAIQDAINACGAAGGGEVYVPEAEFSITSRTGSGGLLWSLAIPWDNVHFWGPGKLTANPGAGTASGMLFWVAGSAKASRMALAGDLTHWYEYWLWEYGSTQYTTLYNLATGTYAKGANTITLNTHAEAGNFSAGDWIGIRTGETGGALHGTPDAELQQVVSANAGTGVIELAEGLKTDYAQEYFITGTSGPTSTTVTANPAYFAVAKATDKLVHNVTIGPLEIEQQAPHFAIGGDQSVHFIANEIVLAADTYGLNGVGRSKNQTISNCTVNLTNAVDHGSANYWIAADTTCTDFTWENLILTSDYPALVHINEGCARITANGFDVRTPAVRGEQYLIRSSARSYDIEVTNSYFQGGGDLYQVYIDTTYIGGAGEVSGYIHDTEFYSPLGAEAFLVSPNSAPEWIYEPLEGLAVTEPNPTVHTANRGQ